MKTISYHTNGNAVKRHTIVKRSLKTTTKFYLSTILFCFLITQTHAQSLLVTEGGNQYELTYVTASYNSIATALMGQPWWGSVGTANAFGNAVVTAEGDTGQWVHGASYSLVSFAYASFDGYAATDDVSGGPPDINEGAGGSAPENNGTISYVEATEVPEPAITSLAILTVCALFGHSLWSRVRHRVAA